MSSMDTTGGYPGAATEHPRQPAGVPVGGQFATATRQEPDVTLAHLTDEDYNADATYEYPPIPRSVAQHVAFWSRVKVPDAVIARVQNAYVERFDVWMEESLEAWAATDPQPRPEGFLATRKYPAEKAAWDARFEAKSAELLNARPRRVPVVLARTLIRCAQMDRYAQMLDTQEQYSDVLATEVDMGEPEPWTVKKTLDVYHLDELAEAAFEDATKMAGLNTALMSMRLSELVEILSNEAQG